MASKLKTKALETIKPTGELRVLQKLNEWEFGVELWLMRDGVNNNKWDYQNLSDYYLTFVGQPILIAYVGSKVGDGHNSTTKRDPRTGETYHSYTGATDERIVGTLSDNKKDFSLVEREGHTWIVAKGKLFLFYAKEAVDTIVRTGRMSVSVETLVEESHMNGEIEVFTKFRGLGVTILGEGVAPAIPGASIAKIAAMSEEFKTLKLKAASLQNNQNNKGVKQMNFLSKTKIAMLAKAFEGYKVLSAAEDEGNIHVCLLSAQNETFGYTMASEAETIVPEKFVQMSVCANFKFGEIDVPVDVCDITENVQICANSAVAEKLQADLDAANSKIQAMETAENARRVNAAKDIANSTLAAFNANREEKIPAEKIACVMTDIEAGNYTTCTDKNGAWNGDKAVSDAVYAICGKSVSEIDAKNKAKNNTTFAWNRFATNNNQQDDGSIEALLNRWGIEPTAQ